MQYKDGIWKKIYEEAVEKVEREQREAAEQERAAAQAPPEAAQPPEEQIICGAPPSRPPEHAGRDSSSAHKALVYMAFSYGPEETDPVSA